MTPLAQIANHPQWDATVRLIAQKAHEAMPLANGRIEKAVALVLGGAVAPHTEGTALVASQSIDGHQYQVNGHCQCADAQHGAPEGWCKHRLAWGIYRRAVAALPREPVAEELPQGEAPAPQHAKVPEQYLVRIQGKPFVRFAGLLDMAHKRGLTELQCAWTYNDDGLSLAKATAQFPFGAFSECGDATPENVTRKVAPHFRRVALTRAKARALRDALGVDLLAVEELGEEA